MKKDNKKPAINEILESAIFIENEKNKISIELPAKCMRKHLTDEQIQKLLDEIGLMIYQMLHKKLYK